MAGPLCLRVRPSVAVRFALLLIATRAPVGTARAFSDAAGVTYGLEVVDAADGGAAKVGVNQICVCSVRVCVFECSAKSGR